MTQEEAALFKKTLHTVGDTVYVLSRLKDMYNESKKPTISDEQKKGWDACVEFGTILGEMLAGNDVSADELTTTTPTHLKRRKIKIIDVASS